MLRVTNRGTGRLSALGDRAVLSFPDTTPGKRAAGSLEHAMRIGLPLAQRILQQHGGRMRVGLHRGRARAAERAAQTETTR